METFWIIFCVVVGILTFLIIIIVAAAASKKGITFKPYKSFGNWGERVVKKVLGEDIPGQYYVYHNLKFKYKDKIAEIDHVVLNKYGIFVIETKDWYGEVIGDNSSEKRTLDNGSYIHQMINPVDQNIVHIKRLSDALDMDPFYFHNIIVFLYDADISRVDSEYVCIVDELRSRLILEHEFFPEERVTEIKEEIDKLLVEMAVTAEEFKNYHRERNRNI